MREKEDKNILFLLVWIIIGIAVGYLLYYITGIIMLVTGVTFLLLPAALSGQKTSETILISVLTYVPTIVFGGFLILKKRHLWRYLGIGILISVIIQMYTYRGIFW